MNKKLNIVLICILILVCISCHNSYTDSSKCMSFDVISIREKYPEALALAKEWMEDSRLFRVVVPIVFEFSSNKEKEILYIFESPSERLEYLSVNCDKAKCLIRVNKIQASYLDSGIDPLYIEQIIIDSAEATQIALINGGCDFITNYSSTGRISLGRSSDDSVRWLAYFADSDIGAINIFIDPFSGDVIGIDR